MTDEFIERLELHIKTEFGSDPSFKRSFDIFDYRVFLIAVWKKDWKTNNEVENLLKSLNLFEPEFTEIEFSSCESGYQNSPRILWKNKIQKIEEINEVFSFKQKQN